MIATLIFLYFFTSAFYGIFGILNLKPGLVTDVLPTYFPLLGDFNKTPLEQSFILLYIAFSLFGVGYLFLTKIRPALLCAALLSAWEVFLSYYYYWDLKHDLIQAVIHLLVHGSALIMLYILYRRHGHVV